MDIVSLDQNLGFFDEYLELLSEYVGECRNPERLKDTIKEGRFSVLLCVVENSPVGFLSFSDSFNSMGDPIRFLHTH